MSYGCYLELINRAFNKIEITVEPTDKKEWGHCVAGGRQSRRAADDAEASPLAGRLFCPSRAERRCALTLFTSTTKNVRRAGGGTLCVFCFRQ